MARLVVSAAVGIAVGMVAGPQAGFAAFSATYGATGFLDPAQKSRGPRLEDTKGTTASYGTTIPYVRAHPRLAGTIVWCSDKQEVANTQEQGGKGGPSSEVTTYTYKIDVRILLSANPIGGVRRVWSNGKLVWSAADDADAETLEASQDTDAWERMTIYTGAADQMPDPVEEAALGIDNCPAYRGRGSVFIEGLNLGGSGYLPNLTFELGTYSDTVDVPGLLNQFSSGPATAVPSQIGPDVVGDVDATVSGGVGSGSTFTATGISGAVGDYWYAESKVRHSVMGGYGLELQGSPNSARVGIFAAASDSLLGTPIGFAVDFTNGAGGNGALEFNGSVAHGPGVYHTYRVEHYQGDLYFYLDGQYMGKHDGDPGDWDGVTFHTMQVSQEALGDSQDVAYMAFNPQAERDDIQLVGYTPTDPIPAWGSPYDIYELSPEPLEDVLTDLCERSGIPQSYVDFSSCSGQLVRALAVTQVTPARQVMEMLGGAYLQEFVEGAGLKTVARGGASALTIPYDDLGASAGDPVEPLPLKRLNDIELPRQFAITYSNVLNDYQNGTEYSDRLLGGSTSVSTTELALGLQPQEAKRIADCKLLDAVAGIIQIGPVGITRAYARLEPTDVITLTDHEGSTFRCRVVKITDDACLRTLELVQDDASAVSSSAVTDEDYESSTVVRSNATTTLEMIDSPIFRDVDDDAGAYAVVTKSSENGIWPGAALYQGLNDAGYEEVVRFADRTFIGVTTTDLAPWTGGNVFDEVSTVTVSGIGTLSSYTRDAIINGTASGYLIGSEVIYARTATLVGTGVYTLSGLLRGQRGTEWAAAEGTDSGARAVLIQAQGWRRVSMTVSQIGVEYDYKAVTFGASVGAVAAEQFTNTAIGLKPFAPVDLRCSRDGTGGFTITWARRSRLSAAIFGTVPLGEASEAYEVDIRDGDDVVRTISVTSASASYNAAQQTADFGAVQSSIDVAVYQVSETVGRGYAITGTLATGYTPAAQSNTITLAGTFAAGVPISVYANGLLIGSRTSVSGDTNLDGIATGLAGVVNAHASYNASAVGSVVTVTGTPGATYALTAVVGGSSNISSVVTQEAAAANPGSRYVAQCFVSNLVTGQTEPIPAGTVFTLTVKQNGIFLRSASFTTTIESARSDVIFGLVDEVQADSFFATNDMFFNAASSTVGGIYGEFIGPQGDPSISVTGSGSSPFSIGVSVTNPGAEPVSEDQSQIVRVTVSGTPSNGEVFRVTLDGTPFTYTATVPTDTREEVIDGLVSSIDADADFSAVQTSTTRFEVSGAVGDAYSYSTSITRGITATVA